MDLGLQPRSSNVHQQVGDPGNILLNKQMMDRYIQQMLTQNPQSKIGDLLTILNSAQNGADRKYPPPVEMPLYPQE